MHGAARCLPHNVSLLRLVVLVAKDFVPKPFFAKDAADLDRRIKVERIRGREAIHVFDEDILSVVSQAPTPIELPCYAAEFDATADLVF